MIHGHPYKPMNDRPAQGFGLRLIWALIIFLAGYAIAADDIADATPYACTEQTYAAR
ncbi:MAG: hypothetical protein FWD62_01630 [Betaproteobacteria bacterium]|nr:hypothetical protein [Betaproteobacteria bacterium]